MKFRLIPLIFQFAFLFGFVFNSFSSQVIIKGNNPDYSGQTLTLLKYDNFITQTESKIDELKVDKGGDFRFHFNIGEPTYVFLHQGVFFIYLYVRPGVEYTVKFPPNTPKKTDERLNPFFEETMVHLLVLDVKLVGKQGEIQPNSELNKRIRDFDTIYNPLMTNYAIDVYSKQNTDSLDSICSQLQQKYDSMSDEPYIKAYTFYRIGLLKFVSTKYRSRNISDNYFLNKPVLYDNPAYMELFNEVYNKYFVYFGRTSTGKKIYTDINKNRSLSGLNSTLQNDNVLSNDTLRELVILKGLHDGFYEMEFSRNALLEILDSVIAKTKIEYHKNIAENIREKVTKLMVGFRPPAIKLLNTDSTLMSLDNFKGKYIYLNFCTTQNYACLKELGQLKQINEKYGKYLNIVTISVDESLSVLKKFVKKSGYKWTFLHYGYQPEILKDYDIRTFPTYYLIDPEGKLTWSPAPSPSENFEPRLFEELRSNGKL